MAAGALTLVSWNLTRRCNLACGHCYLDAVQRKSEAKDELATDEALDIVRQIGAVAPGAMLVLTGGEPLLRDDLEHIVNAAARHGLVPVIGTNGVLLNTALARSLRAAGAIGVGISVDSAGPEFHDRLRGHHGAWSGALSGARAAREAGLALQLQTTLFDENRGELDSLADLAESCGAMALHFFFLVCTGRGVTQSDLSPQAYEATLAAILRLQGDRRERLLVRARCAPYMRRLVGPRAGAESGGYSEGSSACLAGRSYCRITPQGEVTPCPYIPEPVGDLRRSRLMDVWTTSDTLAQLRSGLPGGKCGECDYRLSCGGCRARALATHGDVLAEDPKCDYVRAVGALPEQLPAPRVPSPGAVWTPEAQALLARIPGFVRARVWQSIERAAARAAVTPITVEFMREQRAKLSPFPAHRREGSTLPQCELLLNHFDQRSQ
jgi:AdoMet-dependent heme synthase